VSADISEERAEKGRSGQADDVDRVRGIERRVEALAAEMRATIDKGPREEREALYAYAVSLVGERVAPALDDNPEFDLEAITPSAPQGSGTNAATLIGYGALLLPAGGFLTLVLPPIGMTLALSAVVLIASGAALAVFARLKGIFT
jgi:hypothetical protein